MRLSTRTRYGTRVVISLACHWSMGALPLSIISKEQELSVKYLEQIMCLLKSGNIVRSTRGSKGGYTLTRAPELIKMSEVFICLEGPISTVDCIQDDKPCNRISFCRVRPVWKRLNDTIRSVLEDTTLQDLISNNLTCSDLGA